MSAIGQPRGRGVDLTPDDPILRRVEQAFTSTRIDGAYRRRLRSEVVNRYVAIREGHVVALPLTHRGMMGRLGRACLYASVALAGSSAGLLAGSQSALPGDVLYDIKIRIDELRLQAAPPDMRVAVAEYIVDARLNEAMVLAADGEWGRAELAAAAASASTTQMAGLLSGDADVEARIQAHLAVLAGLIESAPAAAQAALEHAVAVSDHALDDAPHANNGHGAGNGSGNGGGAGGIGPNGNGAGGSGDSANGKDGATTGAADGSPTPVATASASADPTPPASPPGQGNEDGGQDQDETEAAPPSPEPTTRPSPPLPSQAPNH